MPPKSVQGIFLFLGLAFVVFTGPSSAQLIGYDDNFSNPVPALLIDVDTGSGVGSVPTDFAACTGSPPNVIFGVGFTSGLAYVGDTLYGLEWSGNDIYLYSVTVAPSGCATGSRVGALPVGFTNLECLAYCPADGFFYSADFDFAGHTGRLIQIDPATGLGTAVGSAMSTDVRIGGMTYDSVADRLYAVTLSFATRRVELLTIDRTTGVETLVGPTGNVDQTLQSLALDTSVDPARLYSAGTELYELDRADGTGTLVGGAFGTVWGMAFEAQDPPTPTPTHTPGQDPCAVWNLDGIGGIDANDLLMLIESVIAGAPLGPAVDDPYLDFSKCWYGSDSGNPGATPTPTPSEPPRPATEEVQGRLVLPSSLNPSDFEVGNALGMATPDVDGFFTLPIFSVGVTVTGAVPNDYTEGENTWLAVTNRTSPGGAKGPGPELVIDATSTARGLVVLNPNFMTPDPYKMEVVLGSLDGVAELMTLIGLVIDLFPTDLHPFEDAGFMSSYTLAVAEEIDALPPIVAIDPTAKSAELEPPRKQVLNQDGPRVQVQRLDNNTDINLKTALDDLSDKQRITAQARNGHAVDTVMSIRRVDPDGAHVFRAADQTVGDPIFFRSIDDVFSQVNYPIPGDVRFPLYAPFPRGATGAAVAPARSLLRYLDVFGLISTGLTNFLGLSSKTDQLPVDLEEDALFIVRGTNGVIGSGNDFGETEYAWHNHRDQYLNGLFLNLTNGAFELASAVISVGNFVAPCVPDLFSGIGQRFTQVLAGRDIVDLEAPVVLEVLIESAKSGTGSLLGCVANEIKEKPLKGLMNSLKSVVGTINILGKISKVGVFMDRVTTMVEGLAGSPPRPGATRGRRTLISSPMDSHLVVVGNPFAPKITGVGVDGRAPIDAPDQPRRQIAKVGQSFVVEGVRFQRLPTDPLPQLFVADGKGRLLEIKSQGDFNPDVSPGSVPRKQAFTIAAAGTGSNPDGGIPKGLVGELKFIIVTPGGRGESPFLFDLQPKLISLSPHNVFRDSPANLRFRILGYGFDPAELLQPAKHQIFVAGATQAINPLAFESSHNVLSFIPQTELQGLSSGLHEVKVRWRANTDLAPGEPDPLFLRVLGPPKIDSITPDPASEFPLLTINGKNFGDDPSRVEVIVTEVERGRVRTANPLRIESSDAKIAGDTQTAVLSVRPLVAYRDPFPLTEAREDMEVTVIVETPEGQSNTETLVINPAADPAFPRTLTVPVLGLATAINYANQDPAPSGSVRFEVVCDRPGTCIPDEGDPFETEFPECHLVYPDSYVPISTVIEGATHGHAGTLGVTPPQGIIGASGTNCQGNICAESITCMTKEGPVTWEGFMPGEIRETLAIFPTEENPGNIVISSPPPLTGPYVSLDLRGTAHGDVIGGGFVIDGSSEGGRTGNPLKIFGNFHVKQGMGTVLTIQNANGVTLDLKIEGAPATLGVMLENCSNVTLSGTVHNCQTGVIVKNCVNVGITSLTVSGYQDNGIVLDGGELNRVGPVTVGVRRDPSTRAPVAIPSGQGTGILLKGGTAANAFTDIEVVGSDTGMWLQDTRDNAINPNGVGSMIVFASGESRQVVEVAGMSLKNATGIRFSDGAVNNQVTGGFSSTQGGIIGPNDTGILIEGGSRTTLSSLSIGIPNVQDASQIFAEGFSNDVGVLVTGDPEETLIAGQTRFGNNNLYGLEVDTVTATTRIEFCEFGDNAFNAIPDAPNGVAGIHLVNSKNVQLRRNIIRGETIGVHTEDCADLLFFRNDITDPQGEGALLERTHNVTFDFDRVCGGHIAPNNGICDRVPKGGTVGFHFVSCSQVQMTRTRIEGVGGDGIDIEQPPLFFGAIRIEGQEDQGTVIAQPRRRDSFDPLRQPINSRTGDTGRTIVVFDNTGHGIHVHDGAEDVLLAGVTVQLSGENGILIEKPGDKVRLEDSLVTNNNGNGVLVEDSTATGVFIGSPTRGNQITNSQQWGVSIRGSKGVSVQGNFVVSNGMDAGTDTGGVEVANSDDILIGGNGLNGPNLASGNQGDGIRLHELPAGPALPEYRVIGNFVGTNFTGMAAQANSGYGINVLGVPAQPGLNLELARNLVGGNTGGGVNLENIGSGRGPDLTGNIIGRRTLPTAVGVGNALQGVRMVHADDCFLEDNTIGSNAENGIQGIDADLNVVSNNVISGNSRHGILLDQGSSDNLIEFNALSGNTLSGIGIAGGGIWNTLSRNSITTSGGKGIDLSAGANNGIPAPVIRSIANSSTGTKSFFGEVIDAIPDGSLVELFADEGDEGRLFLASDTTVNHRFSFHDVPPATGETHAGKEFHVTVTAPSGDTSEFGILDPITPLARDPGLCPDPPDLRFDAYVASERDGDIALTNIASCTTMFAVTDTADLGYPGVAEPLTDQVIVYTRDESGQSEIYRASGTERINLTNNPAEDLDPSLSPDGTKIAFVSTRDGNHEVYVMNLDGSNVVRLTDNAGDDREPDWSPDGASIVFSSNRGTGTFQLHTMSATDGTGVLARTSEPDGARNPAWRKVDDLIAFDSCSMTEGCRVGILDLDTGLAELLPNGGWNDEQPDWFVTEEGDPYLIVSSLSLEPGATHHLYVMSVEGFVMWQFTPDEATDRNPSCCVSP